MDAVALPIESSIINVPPTLPLSEITTVQFQNGHAFPDGRQAYTKTWQSATQPPRARAVFLHGFADHCNTYGTLFPSLATYGIEVHCYDQRGWGMTATSLEDAGDIGTTAVIRDDLNSFIESVIKFNDQSTPGVQVFLAGHSMGGNNVLTFATSGPESTRRRIRGYAVEAPFVGFPPETKPSWLKVVLGRLGALLAPKVKLSNKVAPEFISRDPKVQREFSEDKLAYSEVTLEGLKGLLDRSGDLESGRAVLKESTRGNEGVSLFVAHGTADKVTSFDAAKEWFDRVEVKDKVFQSYEGWYHRLHAEPDESKQIFARDLGQWFLERSHMSQKKP